MIKKFGIALSIAVVALAFSSRYLTRSLRAEGSQRSIITERIDESRLVRLAGNTRLEANAQNDRGRVPEDMALDHMLLQLKRSPEMESQFARYIESLTDKSSPNFHHWLTAAVITV